MKELLREKEQTIKILRQEMKSLEASASRGIMLSSKMVSKSGERVQSTQANIGARLKTCARKRLKTKSYRER